MIQHIQKMSTPVLVAIRDMAQAGELKKGTWTHCVFNAAGKEMGIKVSNYQAASAMYPEASDFIRIWDQSRQYTTAELLKDVEAELRTRDYVEPTPVNVGRLKSVKTIRKYDSTMYTTEEINFLTELENLLTTETQDA